MGESWISVGNIIKLSEITSSDVSVNYELPLDGDFINELSYEGSYVSYWSERISK